jgi:hypothetical protein
MQKFVETQTEIGIMPNTDKPDEASTIDAFFSRVSDHIRQTVLDEQRVTDWDEFYTFIRTGVEAFFDSAAEEEGGAKLSMALLACKLLLFAYFDAKKMQPNADLEIFKYVYAGAVERYFANIHSAINKYKRMTDDERESVIQEYKDKEARAAAGN